jgi:hypothetical protein
MIAGADSIRFYRACGTFSPVVCHYLASSLYPKTSRRHPIPDICSLLSLSDHIENLFETSLESSGPGRASASTRNTQAVD